MARQSFLVQPGPHNPRLPYIKDAFPILRIQEISDTFWAMGYPVPREQLEKPTFEFILKFLEFWVEELLSFSPTDEDLLIDTLLKQALLQPRDTGSETDQDSDRPDIVADLLPAVRLMVHFKASKHMMNKLAMHDFTLMDLLRPESARVVRILSAIINFVRFRDEQSVRWREPIQEITIAQQKVLDMDVQLTAISNEILRLRGLLELGDELASSLLSEYNRSPKWTRANELNDGLRTEVKRLSDLSNAWLDKCKAMKVAVTLKYQKIVSLEEQISTKEEECARLQTYSLMNLAEINKALEDMKATLRSEEEELRQLDSAERNVNRTAQAMHWLDEELQKLSKLGSSILESSKTVEQSQEQVSRSNDELNTHRLKIERLDVQQSGLEKKVEASEAKLRALQEMAKDREDEVQQRQTELYAEYDQLSQMREKHQAELDTIKKENEQLSAQTGYLQDQYQHEYNEALDELARLNLLIRDYISEIRSLIT